MTNLVSGLVRHLGRVYADGAPNLEIHIPIEKTGNLPIQIGVRTSVKLIIDQIEYVAGLRSTTKNTYAWICPDIYLSSGERFTLGRVLTDAEFSINEHVHLAVNGSMLILRHE